MKCLNKIYRYIYLILSVQNSDVFFILCFFVCLLEQQHFENSCCCSSTLPCAEGQLLELVAAKFFRDFILLQDVNGFVFG